MALTLSLEAATATLTICWKRITSLNMDFYEMRYDLTSALKKEARSDLVYYLGVIRILILLVFFELFPDDLGETMVYWYVLYMIWSFRKKKTDTLPGSEYAAVLSDNYKDRLTKFIKYIPLVLFYGFCLESCIHLQGLYPGYKYPGKKRNKQHSLRFYICNPGSFHIVLHHLPDKIFGLRQKYEGLLMAVTPGF